jgi:hypothetical protein
VGRAEMDVTERKVPTLINRKTEGTRHKLTLDMTGCEDKAKKYLEDMGIQYAIDENRPMATFTLDAENESGKAILNQLITDTGIGKKIAGYGIIRALAFPLEFHEEVEETDYGKVASATTVQIGAKKKKELGLWVWEYIVPVLLAIIVGVGYTGFATHQRNMDLYTPITLDQLKGKWFQEYHRISGMDAWLNPATNKFTLSFPVDSIISEAKKLTLVKFENDTILIVGSPDNADGIWYPEERQFVGNGEQIVEFLHPDSIGLEEFTENSIDPMTIEYNRIDDIRNRFEEGRDKKSAQLTGTVVFDSTKGDFYMPVRRGKIKLLVANELQKLYLNVSKEATIMGKMRFYQWVNENDANRSRRDTQIVGEFDIEVLKIWNRYM